MDLGKRALLYLTRKKGRSILLVLLIFVMASFILIGLALKTSADEQIKEIRNSLGSSFVLQASTDAADPSVSASDPDYSVTDYSITQDMIDSILNVDGVTDYFTSLEMLILADLDVKPGGWAAYEPDEENPQETLDVVKKMAMVKACSNGELAPNFRTGAFELVDGRNIQAGDHNKAVISKYIAEQNNLSLGDTFSVSEWLWPDDAIPEKIGEPAVLEVVGIFDINFEQEASYFTNEFQYAENYIYTDMNTGFQLLKIRDAVDGIEIDENTYGNDWGYFETTFFVDNPENLDQIMEQIRENIGLKIGMTMTQDDTAYRASVRPLRWISIASLILLLTGIIGCAAILVLLLTMWIRSRQHEIGIFLSIGIRKSKIVAQMLLECITASVIGLILSLLLSGVMINGSCKAAEYLTAPDSEEAVYSVDFEFMKVEPRINKISSKAIQLEADISIQDVFLVILVICLISSGSVLLASNVVMRMKPRELLQTM